MTEFLIHLILFSTIEAQSFSPCELACAGGCYDQTTCLTACEAAEQRQYSSAFLTCHVGASCVEAAVCMKGAGRGNGD